MNRLNEYLPWSPLFSEGSILYDSLWCIGFQLPRSELDFGVSFTALDITVNLPEMAARV